jgi:hypothetical protein
MILQLTCESICLEGGFFAITGSKRDVLITFLKVTQAIVLVVTAKNIYQVTDAWGMKHFISYNSVSLAIVFHYSAYLRSIGLHRIMMLFNLKCWCIP